MLHIDKLAQETDKGSDPLYSSEPLPVRVTKKKDGLLRIAARGEVVEGPGKLQT